MAQPDLRVILDGDSSRLYRQGEQVKGRVVLVLQEPEDIRALKLNFVGACITRTTRPIYLGANGADARKSRRDFEERIELFNLERIFVSGGSLTASKHCWNFEFTFPLLTESRHSRWGQGTKYAKDPHPLPPSFQVQTNSPGGQAAISYDLHAQLVRYGSKSSVRANQMVAYQPKSRNEALEVPITSRVLYNQTFKPFKSSRTAMDKVLRKVTRKASATSISPRIIPTIHHPERIAPRQNILLGLSLSVAEANAEPDERLECILDSLTISIATYTSSRCGKSLKQPEDVMSKHMTCIQKQNMNKPLTFDAPTPLTTNFRLVDDAECVPSFRTYSINRAYSMTVTMGIRCRERKFVIKCSMPLEILPRMTLAPLNTRVRDDDEVPVDPLPLYMPRAPSSELAPDYETLYSLSPTPSYARSFADAISSSTGSGASTPQSGASTPASEIEQPVFAVGAGC
ncbi:hypothetical protein EJ04DRAFT_548837 [Polyplosphaeria fusca]|uniref:Arrestin-like N-terminal domain-containing protein n=1 Tax=Polyplosphaeria fusca TaxID=682080 RepID=A0A9P4R615_9PLEO|nr:hypothetical protein EJ04DRAFT_548837 [Polyplosphaeria fusca]